MNLDNVLDDLSNPGLFSRSSGKGFGFKGFYDAERIAYTMQYGKNPVPLTAFNAGMQSNPKTTTIVAGGVVYVVFESSSYIFGQ